MISECLIPTSWSLTRACSYIANSTSTSIYVAFSISALDQMVEIDHDVKRGLARCQSWGLWQGEFLGLWLFTEMDQGMSTSDDYKNYVQLFNRSAMLKPHSYRLTAIRHQTTVHKKTLVIMAVSRYSSVWKKPILMPAIQSCNICKEITISTRPTTDVRLIFYVFLYILFAKYRWRCSG